MTSRWYLQGWTIRTNPARHDAGSVKIVEVSWVFLELQFEWLRQHIGTIHVTTYQVPASTSLGSTAKSGICVHTERMIYWRCPSTLMQLLARKMRPWWLYQSSNVDQCHNYNSTWVMHTIPQPNSVRRSTALDTFSRSGHWRVFCGY
jgi:hypothetical protein